MADYQQAIVLFSAATAWIGYKRYFCLADLVTRRLPRLCLSREGTTSVARTGTQYRALVKIQGHPSLLASAEAIRPRAFIALKYAAFEQAPLTDMYYRDNTCGGRNRLPVITQTTQSLARGTPIYDARLDSILLGVLSRLHKCVPWGSPTNV